MTTLDTGLRHCEHECVCCVNYDFGKDPCYVKRCKNDTRNIKRRCFILQGELAHYRELLEFVIASKEYIGSNIIPIDLCTRDIENICSRGAVPTDRPRPPCEECIYQLQSSEHDTQIRADERQKIIADNGITVSTIYGYEAGVREENARMRKELKDLKDSCECVPLRKPTPFKAGSSEFDRGFHQAMTLVRGWIDQKIESNTAKAPEHPKCFGKNCHSVSDPLLCETCKSLEECKKEYYYDVEEMKDEHPI